MTEEKERKRGTAEGKSFFISSIIARLFGRNREQQAKYDPLLLIVRPANEGGV